MRKSYKTFLAYSDGSLHPGEVFCDLEKMRSTLRAIARKPGVRYLCEEWTAPVQDQSVAVKITEYDI